MDELFSSGSMEEGHVCTQGWMQLMCVHLLVLTFPYLSVQTLWSYSKISLFHVGMWTGGLLQICSSVWELSPLLFRPKLSTEKIVHFFFIKNDFGLTVNDFISHLDTCTLSTLPSICNQGHFPCFLLHSHSNFINFLNTLLF